MKEYPVGTICVIVQTDNYPELIGTEVTITEPLSRRESKTGRVWLGYGTDLEHKGFKICPQHSYVKPKRPKDEKFEEFMKHLLKPVGLPEEDLV